MWGDVHKFILDLLVLFVYMTDFRMDVMVSTTHSGIHKRFSLV
jgi:hypothetical protein